MPSSLIFAALAAAWLVVLVPMVAKRRQEVVRTAESALASRVLHRPGPPRVAHEHGQQVRLIGERIAQRESILDEHRYRSGRGGYDPEVAAQLAREKYAFRQRVVLGLAIAAVASLVLAYIASSLLWWVHAVLDLALVGYLGYLRRQVRIEDEVRRRRAARAAGSRPAGLAPDVRHDVATDGHRGEGAEQEPSSQRPAVSSAPPHTAVALDLDDEDPTFDELQPAFKPPYRRAVGE
ncbi:MAG: gephyrin-like molybdotransferase receptor GlpR [Pseudonocardiaceae bacterium]